MKKLLLVLSLVLVASSSGAQTETKPTSFAYGLVIDCSGSVRENLQYIRASASAIINANSEGEQTFVTKFISSDRIANIQEMTSDKSQLVKSLEKLYPEGGQTALIDGVWFAAHYLADHTPQEHRALVVITDGEDRASYYTETELLKYLKDKHIPVHVLTYGRNLKLLNTLAQESGGKVVLAHTGKDLPSKAAEVVRLLQQ